MREPIWICEFDGRVNSAEQRTCTYCMRTRYASRLERDRKLGKGEDNE